MEFEKGKYIRIDIHARNPGLESLGAIHAKKSPTTANLHDP